jgi:hypothetical protein
VRHHPGYEAIDGGALTPSCGSWHTLVPHEVYPGYKVIQWQFEIMRRLGDDRYVCQLLSWIDGRDTIVTVMRESDLLNMEKCKLYLNKDEWHDAAEENSRLRDMLRRHEKAEKAANEESTSDAKGLACQSGIRARDHADGC